jgi:hypothetical protein
VLVVRSLKESESYIKQLLMAWHSACLQEDKAKLLLISLNAKRKFK